MDTCPKKVPRALLLLSVLLAFACGRESSARSFPQEELRAGDLAFRCGTGMVSRVVTTVEDGCIYSHVGVLAPSAEGWQVVHAVPYEASKDDFDRVKAEPLEVFFSAKMAAKGCLVHTGLAEEEALALCSVAFRQVRDSVRFDSAYDLTDSSRLYCTEFVWRLYRRAGVDLSEGRRIDLSIPLVHGECLLPEHLYHYKNNIVYYQF